MARFVVSALAAVALFGCREQRGTQPPPPPASTTAVPVATASLPAPAVVHDPANPPIDCPLRKAGVNAKDLKPFEQIEQYIAFLEREDRAQWQKPDAVIAALGLAGKETIADVGAGSGYFSFRFARALPSGRVVALDVEPEMVRHIHHKAMTEQIGNVEARLAPTDDPAIPAEADLIFLCDVLHHVPDTEQWLARLAAQARPGARLVLIEFKQGELPEGPPATLKIAKKELVTLATGAGFRLVADKSELLPYQEVLVFER